MNITSQPTNDSGAPGVREPGNAERKARFYHPELDVLRFFAFLVVFIHHAFDYKITTYVEMGIPVGIAQWLRAIQQSGGLGVDLFFLLSSYLITELLIREIDLRGSLDIKSFYIRRLLRIWPLYFLFLGFSMAVVPHFLEEDLIPLLHGFSFSLFLGNWTTAYWGYPNSVIAPLWSVSIEEQFYIIWPLLVMMTRGRHIIRLGIALIALAFISRIFLLALGVPHPAIWATTFTRLDPIALGAIIAVLLKGRAPVIGGPARVGLILGGLALWPISHMYFGLHGPGAMVTYPIVAIGCGAILLGVLCKQPAWRAVRGGAFVYLGRISYGLYVYHMLVITTLQVYWLPKGIAEILLRIAAALLATVVLAIVSYHVVEQPFLKLKRRFSHVHSRDTMTSNALPPSADAQERRVS